MADLLADPNLPPERKQSLLPVLVILFLISYGLLTRLVVEQDRVIGFQLTLIKQMLSDSNELAALKGKIKREQNQSEHRWQAQPPQSQPPQSQGSQNSRPKNHHETRRPKLLPERPPIPASDAMDERRAQIKI